MTKPPLIRTFSYHYRQVYNAPVGKLPVDTGIICPNRSRGGCIYCLPESFSPGYLKGKDPVDKQIASGKSQFLNNRFRLYFLYFQQETCTASPVEALLGQVQTGLNDDDCVGIILSTRPDYLSRDLLHPLAETVKMSGKECLFELGLQSMHDKSLKFLNRNHTVDDFIAATQTLSNFPVFSIGAHLMFGIPGEDISDMLDTVRRVCSLPVTHLKLHHLQVIRGTELHRQFNLGKINLFSREQYLELLQDILPIIPRETVIHRLWASSHPDLLIAPKWNILATHLSRELRSLMEARGIHQGCHY